MRPSASFVPVQQVAPAPFVPIPPKESLRTPRPAWNGRSRRGGCCPKGAPPLRSRRSESRRRRRAPSGRGRGRGPRRAGREGPARQRNRGQEDDAGQRRSSDHEDVSDVFSESGRSGHLRLLGGPAHAPAGGSRQAPAGALFGRGANSRLAARPWATNPARPWGNEPDTYSYAATCAKVPPASTGLGRPRSAERSADLSDS